MLLTETNIWSGSNNFTGILQKNGINVLTNIPPNGANNALVIWLTTNSQSFISNGIGMLTNDGSGNFGYTTNVTQDITYNNINSTNITTVNNTTTSNLFYITGKGNTLTVTNALNLISLGTNKLLRIGADGAVTNIANSSGVLTNDGSGGFSWTTNVSSGGSSSGASVWIPNTALTYSGSTNITIDGSG